MKHTKSKN